MIAADESRSVTTPPEFNSASPPVEAFKICAPPKTTFVASGFYLPNTTIIGRLVVRGYWDSDFAQEVVDCGFVSVCEWAGSCIYAH